MRILRNIPTNITFLVISIVLLASKVAAAAPALPPALRPPAPGNNKNAPAVWIGMLLMVVLAGIVIAISLMPSRRGHQD